MKKLSIVHGQFAEIRKNCLSAAANLQKTEKTAFRPWPICRNQKKLYFGHGQFAKNEKICLSATANLQKDILNRIHANMKEVYVIQIIEY